ncbi:MAG TPA: ParB/RepB/Spo0J family partition protein [Steroidobacteraceae bacterium]
MTQKKPTLGRGLADLLGQARPPAGAAGAATLPHGEHLTRVPLDLLQRGKYQPRLDMRPESLSELAESIRAQGVVQPILVRPVGIAQASGQRYEIIAGERRWRAAQLAGLTEIPAVIRDVPDEDAIAVALIENIQREDLNPLEEARALERLIAEFGLTHQQVATAIGRSRAAVTNLLRLLELAPEVCALLESRAIDMGHARALLGLENRRKQIEVATMVAKKGLSVRDTEGLVRRMTQPQGARADSGSTTGKDPNVQRLEEELGQKLGAKVAIQHGGSGRGKVIISYHTLDELDGILGHIH